MSSPTPKNDAAPPPPQCQRCVRMLTKVLMSKDSRPLTLLKALGASSDLSLQPDGVVVDLPKKQAKITRRWTQYCSQEEKRESVPLPHVAAVAASSAAPTQPQRNKVAATSSSETHNDDVAPLLKDSLKIECRPCGDVGPEGAARAYVMGPDPLSIVLCSNRLLLHDQKEMEQVLVHELTHVYDVRVQKLDLQLCESLAYSEVRAAREAECYRSWVQPYCTKQKAITATNNLFPTDGRECIRKVFDRAMADTRPFNSSKTQSHDPYAPKDSQR